MEIGRVYRFKDECGTFSFGYTKGVFIGYTSYGLPRFMLNIDRGTQCMINATDDNFEEVVAHFPSPKPEAKLPEKVEYKGEYSFFADLHKECFVVAEDMLIIKKELNELIDYITELRKELDYLKQKEFNH